jgi:hypothetical protein
MNLINLLAANFATLAFYCPAKYNASTLTDSFNDVEVVDVVSVLIILGILLGGGRGIQTVCTLLSTSDLVVSHRESDSTGD